MNGDTIRPSSQPFIDCLETDGGAFHFSIVVEGLPLLTDIVSLPSAISSFIHVSFILNLHYPKGAEMLADILQRRFARFGSHSGTRTGKKPKTAIKKMEEFYKKLGVVE